MTKGIRYYSLPDGCGYGDAAVSYMDALVKQGIPLRWSPLVSTKWGFAPWHLLPDHMKPAPETMISGSPDTKELLKCLEKDVEYDTVFLHSMPELWPKLVEVDKVNIGYTVWETDRLPRHWPELLPSVGHLCVPCEFNQKLFTSEQGPPVSCVPHAIRQPLPHDSLKTEEYKDKLEIEDGMYVFYIIATWDPRKAMKETLLAYLRAFDANDKVCLLIKTGEEWGYIENGQKSTVRQMVNEIIANYPHPAKVVLITERVSQLEIQHIHEIGDCFFSLTHCEGWGMGAFDAAAAGNSVVITGWGGQLDYLPADSSYHLDFTLQTVEEKRGWESYDNSQKWAYVDMENAVSLLRHCYLNQKEARDKGLQLRQYVNDRFSFEQVTSSLLGAIDDAHST